MGDVVRAVLDAVAAADPEYGAKTLEPIRPGEHAVGNLPVPARRVHAILTLQHEQIGEHLRLYESIRSDPAKLDCPETINSWIFNNRVLRTRIAILESMLTLSVYDAFPDVVLHDNIVIREGFVVAWSDEPVTEDEKMAAATAVIIRDSLKNRPS